MTKQHRPKPSSYAGRVEPSSLTFDEIAVLQPGGVYPLLKRFIDILVAALLLLFSLPFILLVGLVIRSESPGPALFRQRRVGRAGSIFLMYKLRSMRSDTNGNSKGEATARFAAPGDSRITTIGRYMRMMHIDELPQLWCVLRGEMSLVGPRPEQISFAANFAKTIAHYDLRHLVRPGISGWAQVTQGYADDETSTAEKLRRDLFYIKNMSFGLDLLVLAMTLREVIIGRGL